jgi:hypothetical protein
VHAVGVVDDKHAGVHAADDQLVDLAEVCQVDAALLGECLGPHLLAECEAQRGGRVKPKPTARTRAGRGLAFDQAADERLADDPHRRQRSKEQPSAAGATARRRRR